MSELKCPFCGKPLQPTLRIPDEYWCENYDCPQTNIGWVGTSALWQALIDTKKKLDVCIRGLDQMTWGCNSADAEDLLKQIKDKEQ